MSDEVEQGHSVAEAGAVYATEPNGQSTGMTRPGNNGKGRIVAPWNAEQARQAARKRWDAASAAVRRGLAKASEQVPGLSIRGPLAAIEYAAEQHGLNMFDPSAHGSQQSMKLLLDYAYPKPERDPAAAVGVPAGGATLALSPELAQQLLSAMRERRQQGE